MNAQQRCSFLAALILAPTLAMGAASAQTLTAPPAPNAITAPAQKTIGVPAARQYSQALIVLNARGSQARRQAARARRRAAQRHALHQPSGAQRRPHGDARHGRDLAHRQLRQGSAQRHRVGVLQGRLQRERRRGRTDHCQARGRAAHLRRQGPRGQPRQGRRPGLGLHRHAVVGSRLERVHLLRPEPDDRRHHAQHRRPERHQHLHRLVQSLAHRPYVPPPTNYGPAPGAPPPPDIDPRYQQRFNAPTCGKPPLLPCY